MRVDNEAVARSRLGKARVMLADFYLDQAIAIADDAKDDWIT
jgi:hypothetical protein